MRVIYNHNGSVSGYRSTDKKSRGLAVYFLTVLYMLVVLVVFSGCSLFGGDQSSTEPQPVNGFGTAANHSHSLVALSDHTLVLASHYGLFRSLDDGKSWKKVAAGSGQIMEGLMTESLTVSSLSQNRMYVLTQIVPPAAGSPGLYTSADEGKTWQAGVTTKEMGNMFFARAGNNSPDEVYVYTPRLGNHGLQVSKDAGKHFTSVGTIPFGSLSGILPLPNTPGHLLIYGDEGIARSTDSGAHWEKLSGITSAVYSMTTGGANRPIYATGDAGIYASIDGGQSFTMVRAGISYGGLNASPLDPQLVYGKTASAIVRSSDGGHTWQNLASIKGSLDSLAADPNNVDIVYLSLSYPTEVKQYSQTKGQWSSLTPPKSA